MAEQTFLTRDDLEKVPQELLPMPVLSDNLRSFFSWGIKAHTTGNYNHFMWMIYPGVLASQNFLFQTEPVKNYVKKCRLKLWQSTVWTPEERDSIIKTIEKKLSLPWYKKIYDVPAIFGQLTWREIQIPGLNICSDFGEVMRSTRAEPTYDLIHPDPQQINCWLEEHPERFGVYGRYVPD